MDQPVSRRERKKVQTRQRLLEAALNLFHEKGYSATTVEEIASKADVAKGTFFNYFPSKEALLHELTLPRVEQLSTALDVSKGAPASPVARIKLLMQLLHEQATPHMRLTRRAFAMHVRTSPPPPSEEARHRFDSILTGLVSEAQAWGEIRTDVDADLVCDLLRMACFRQMVACSHEDSDSPPISYERIIDLLLDGLAGPGRGCTRGHRQEHLDT